MASRRPLREGPPSPPPPRRFHAHPPNTQFGASPPRRPLREGDIVNVDVTAFLGGYHGDTNATFYVVRGHARGEGGVRTPQASDQPNSSHTHTKPQTARRASPRPTRASSSRPRAPRWTRPSACAAPARRLRRLATPSRRAARGAAHTCMRACAYARALAHMLVGHGAGCTPPPFTHAARRRRCAHVRRARAGGPRHRARLPRGARRAAPQARSFSRARACLGRGTAVGPPPRGALIAGKHPRCVRSSPPTCPAPFPPAGMGAPAPCSWARPSP